MDLVVSNFYAAIDSVNEFLECNLGSCFNLNPIEKISTQFRIIFLTEKEHRNPSVIRKNVSVLKREFDASRGDAIWVEDDEMKPRHALNLCQIEGFDISNAKTLEGFDNHESVTLRESIAALIQTAKISLDRLESVPSESMGDFYLLKTIAIEAEIPEWVEIEDFEKSADKMPLLISSMKQYLVNLKNSVGSKEFPKRQIHLAAKIQKFLQDSSQGVLFILIGAAHLDLNNTHSQRLINSLEGHTFTII